MQTTCHVACPCGEAERGIGNGRIVHHFLKEYLLQDMLGGKKPFEQAYQQQDSSTMNSALKGIVAGVMMAGISTVLTFLGF